MEKLVSIIMPAYNCADYIAESIKSVQNQSYRNWELIVADDNSTDGTVDTVRSVAADDNRIHLLETDINLGPAAARNRAINAAQGDYIAFLDSDDIWYPDKLSRQISFMEQMGYDFTYGICDAPSGMLRSFALMYGESPNDITGECYGLNHLSYFKSIKLKGREIMPELIENDEAYKKSDMRYFEKELLRDRGCVLNEYLYYFYYREKAVENILKADQTRGEQIRDINKSMTTELSQMDIENDFENCLKIFSKWYGMREGSYMASETGEKRTQPWHFDIYEEDDGGYAGVALKFIETAQSGTKGTMIMCIPNDGSIDGLRNDDVVEITCDVDKNGCTPHRIGKVDEQNLELIRRVKNYERLSSKAIRERSRSAAIQALTLHPLVNSYSIAVKLVDEFIEHNKNYCGGWK